MRVTSALARLSFIPVVWSTCYSPIGKRFLQLLKQGPSGLIAVCLYVGREIDSIDTAFERELSKCPGNDVCCWSDQECLTDMKLCKDKRWGYRREYCARPGWPEETCSQLCMMVGEGSNSASHA